eukprot:TRINITY_DN122952_c0_g1_i1.p1 TRINITY_DN122952_c0_g1~~TRINITY_DN122952_c0_g1_i1.p1  ORF type:complete len:447 (-),score=87.01 TRINITY_DN122952_c0_g1_i1:650-1933(-)
MKAALPCSTVSIPCSLVHTVGPTTSVASAPPTCGLPSDDLPNGTDFMKGAGAALITASLIPGRCGRKPGRGRKGASFRKSLSSITETCPDSTMPRAKNFAVVDYGLEWKGPGPAICCDGLVPGVSLQLTHWTGNQTEDRYYADTSTEIALNMVGQARAASQEGNGSEMLMEHMALLSEATVVNNHFDTDGVLACWTLLNPDAALARQAVLEAAAVVGDFQEWPALHAEAAMKLDAAIDTISQRSSSTAAAYDEVFSKLPKLIDDIVSEDPVAADMWQKSWTSIVEGRKLLESGALKCWLEEPGIAVVEHPVGVGELPGPIYNLAFKSEVDAGKVRRFLLVLPQQSETGSIERHFIYERPRHSWVSRLVKRTAVEKPDAKIMEEVVRLLPQAENWKKRGTLAGLLQTEVALAADVKVEDVIKVLKEHD